MEPAELLTLFDHEMRIDPPLPTGYRLERTGAVVRLVGAEDACILFATPTPGGAGAVVAEQVRSFDPGLGEVEWKVYSHDRAAELDLALAAGGFVPTPVESLMVLSLDEFPPITDLLPDLELRRVTDERGLADAVAVDTLSFARDDGTLRRLVQSRLRDPSLGLFVAYLDGRPVASGRVEMDPGKSFAGLWGGGTVPSARHRGVYRALTGARAALAREKGFRFLYVEARPETSRPILERVGFQYLADVVGWLWHPAR